jgi:hypothetical protein
MEFTMQTFAHTLFAAGILASGAAHAAELRPLQASGIALGELAGVAYYTRENDGYHVVATLAAGENAAPVRFAATLLPGQKTTLSVPRAGGRDAASVEISRIGDRVIVTRGKEVANAATE